MIQFAINCFESVSSTNDIAAQMAKSGAPEGTVIIAKQQTKGRGRRGRIWLDEPGQNVLLSIILRPNKQPDELSQLSFVASLSVADTLHQLGLQCSLKWPNDVYVGSKKISGILLEVIFCDNGPAVVIGMGININQTAFQTDIAKIATSLAIELETKTEPDIVSDMLLKTLASNYEKYLMNGFDGILFRWAKHMWGIGAGAEVISQGNTIQGDIIGLDKRGALMLKDASGAIHRIIAADAVNLLVKS